MVNGLDPARYRPLVVLPYAGELAPALSDDGIETVIRPLAVLRRGLMSAGGVARIAAARMADARALGGLARERGVALVHSNTSVVLGGAAAARRAGLPHVWHVREIYEDVPARAYALHRRLLAGADALPCVSAATRDALGLPRARVLHDGLARAPERAERGRARAALGLDGDAFVVALLGRISAWKGQDVLARALAEPALAARGAIGVVAGSAWRDDAGPEDELHALRTRLRLGDRLRILGFRHDPENVLGAADVVVVPSTRPDPLPNAALEAAAAGCCVVASAHGGLPEILREGVTGRLLPPGDHRMLAAALAALADDPDQRERLGAAAAADVAHRFAPDRLLAALQALYDDLLGAADRVAHVTRARRPRAAVRRPQ
jgi:glycosyltransferase involved in cell wall biosynthesis